MAKPIDPMFEDAIYDQGSKTPAGEGFTTGSFPGLEPNAKETLDVVILEYGNLSKPAGVNKFGLVDNGD